MLILRENSLRLIPGLVENTSKIWENVLHLATRHAYRKDSYFTIPEDNLYTFGYLKSGYLYSQHPTFNGTARIVLFLGPGTLFRETYVCSGFASSMPVHRCMTDVETYLFPGKILHDPEFIQTHFEHIQNCLYSVSVKLTMYDFSIFIEGCKTVQEKIATWIYGCYNSIGCRTFSPGLSQLDVGLFLGIHKSSFNTAIRAMKRSQVISSFTKKKITILDEKKLLAISRGELVL